MKNVAAVILAAGGSTRFGQPKQLLDWGGVPLVAHVADQALAAGLSPVIVALGSQAEAVRAALGTRPVQIAMNWHWEAGLSTSVQAGLAVLPPETEAAVFLHCDQPLVNAALLRALVHRFEESRAPVVYSTHAGQRHPPVLFARRLFPELTAIAGDEGGRAIITQHPGEVATVEVADAHILADIDTPDDYERLLRITNHESPSANRTSPIVSIRSLIVDMDGVLWRGDTPMAGLDEFFAFLHEREIGFILATNNSSRLPEQYAEKLARFGVEVSPERILTSSQAAAAYLATVAPPGTRVYAIGEEGVRRALEERGFVLTDEGAAYVVVGWDRQLTWSKLATAALLIYEGAAFIGTNPDPTYPVERGPVPGNGAQLAALQTATGVTPLVVGKPEPPMYEEAIRRMGARRETTAVIGDRLDTDIAGGVRLGLTTVLVLSGIATQADVAASPIKPDLVCADIREFVALVRAAWGNGRPEQ